jgi:hypothetical protein
MSIQFRSLVPFRLSSTHKNVLAIKTNNDAGVLGAPPANRHLHT